ncbi:hypothetical protein GWR56_11085 [Mucilaginibacter sp. 14171R-50]|uniref:hypothetical protein n=1 Tax=Mucilaginibacter sp. 14171R-50 TaxID=2703789 RepID=UPI00138D4346|nr:hypothetical protein [Mucilaginibacter sp. 14171R-50]QHS56052.1 hypothetical protein GWR56_11085 [Mucilaginibacter sp. 14171R-50]
MKYIFCILLTYIYILTASGQDKYLKPSELNSETGILKDYYIGLFPLLYKDFSDKPSARYTLIPSFSSEFAFSVEEKANHFFINSNHLSTSYWYSKNKSKVKVKHASTEITKDFYNRILTLFNIALKQTRQPEEKTMGFDGETSYLSAVVDGHIINAETWSPDQTSHMGLLVEICKKLYLIGLGKSTSQTEVSKEIDQLLIELQK